MNYTSNPGSVRVDFFKPSGKWYMTEEVDMSDYWDTPTSSDAVEAALEDVGRNLKHFTRVVLEPYHRFGYPVLLAAKEEF